MTGRPRSYLIAARRLWTGPVVFTVVFAIILSGEASVLEPRSSSGPLAVEEQLTQTAADQVTATFRLTALAGTIEVHLALLPGATRRVTSVAVFYDPAFAVRFANPSDVLGLEARLASYLTEAHPRVTTTLVDAAGLPAYLANNPNGAVVIFGYGTLPDDVFSKNVTLLKQWIDEGGELIWAGGPLGYFEGHVTPAGTFQHSDLGWNGQLDLLGFPLEDPIGNPATKSQGPLLSYSQSGLGQALGIVYSGTADGANVTEVVVHNGTVMGFNSTSQNGSAPRTSLAYIPVSNGGVFYFGGALWGTGYGVVPQADLILSGDVTLLAGTGYVPLPGPAASANVTVYEFHSITKSLVLSGAPTQVLPIASSVAGGAYLFLWSG